MQKVFRPLKCFIVILPTACCHCTDWCSASLYHLKEDHLTWIYIFFGSNFSFVFLDAYGSKLALSTPSSSSLPGVFKQSSRLRIIGPYPSPLLNLKEYLPVSAHIMGLLIILGVRKSIVENIIPSRPSLNVCPTNNYFLLGKFVVQRPQLL